MLAGSILLAAGGCIATAAVLLAHHGCVHSMDDPTSAAKRESCAAVCYFQRSDVCKFSACNHENWILLCLGVGLAFLVAAVFYV